jgi:TolA-binding protein
MIPTPSRPTSQRHPAVDDFDDELRDIKREIVESRGLIIKTNNLTNALAADLKSISRRQLGFERRAFWNSAGANLLFVVVVIGVVKLAWDARIDAVTAETSGAKQKVAKLEKDFEDMKRRGDDRTRAESAFFTDAVEKARAEISIKSYQLGLDHMRTGRWHEAAMAFEDAIQKKDTAAHTPAARLNLARAYRKLNRQRDAIPMLVQLSEASTDKEVMDDATFLLAECLIDIQAWNDAKSTLRSFIRRFPDSAFINDARMALADLSLKH